MLKRLKKAFKWLSNIKLECGCSACKIKIVPEKVKCDKNRGSCKCKKH